MAPFVHFVVDLDRLFPMFSRWDDAERAARIEFEPEPVGIEGFIVKQRLKRHTIDQRPDPHDVVALAWHQDKAQQVAEGIDQRHDFGRQSAFRAPDSLILSPPLAPVAFW